MTSLAIVLAGGLAFVIGRFYARIQRERRAHVSEETLDRLRAVDVEGPPEAAGRRPDPPLGPRPRSPYSRPWGS